MQSRAERLRSAVQVLVADYGFKEAVTSAESETVLSALASNAGRSDADLAAFFDQSGQVLATTIPDLADAGTIDWPVGGTAVSDSGVVYRAFNGRPYLLVIAPVRAPVPVGWVAIGFRIDAALWHAQGIDFDVSINLSAADLSDPELPQLVRRRLRGAGVLASRLVLEITESVVMRETARALRVMEELRHDGVRFSIDDFGTGYSSLAQLKRLPVDEIKIDKSFVLDLNRHTDAAVIVRSTIELGQSLGVKVVAEGVETAESWDLLRQMGCDMAQGYFISAPLPAAEIAGWVRSWNTKFESAETPTQQVHILKEHRRSIV